MRRQRGRSSEGANKNQASRKRGAATVIFSPGQNPLAHTQTRTHTQTQMRVYCGARRTHVRLTLDGKRYSTTTPPQTPTTLTERHERGAAVNAPFPFSQIRSAKQRLEDREQTTEKKKNKTTSTKDAHNTSRIASSRFAAFR
jgi:hypothetical protein